MAEPPRLEGMHDIYYGTQLPPHSSSRFRWWAQPTASARQYLRCDPSKVIAVVETHSPDRNSAFSPPDENSRHASPATSSSSCSTR
ncbi:hypothetical protein [Thauera humireducens]|uniref:hypothetical protein n=1 Tax=Thauera humireducens TaxID=1134435 RepID=UPI00311ED9CC